MAESAALTKRNADTALMPPPALPTKKIKRPKNVLDEDVYTNAIDHIIARDFFPGLVEARAQTDYLDALGSNDKSWIRDAGQKLTQVMTPGPQGRNRRGTSLATTVCGTPMSAASTPGGGITSTTTPSRGQSAISGVDSQGQKVDVNMSLDAFQAKYISEDNESFDALLDKQNAKRTEKYAYLYNGNKIPGQLQIKQAEHKRQQLLANEEAIANNALISRPSADPTDRKASYDTFTNRSGPRNALMFGPDSVEDTHATLAQAAADRSLAAPKGVNYSRTRLDPIVQETSIPQSPSLSAIDAAIAGHPPTSTAASTLEESGFETPRVKGYAFVDAEPTPSELGIPIDETQVEAEEHQAAMSLMPRLDPQGKSGFKLLETSKREALLDRLVAKQDASRRTHQNGSSSLYLGMTPSSKASTLLGGRTSTPSFASYTPLPRGSTPARPAQRAGNLTPAGRMLAAALGKTPARSGFGIATPARISRVTSKIHK